MREIKLTQGKIAIIDDEDLERVSGLKWCASFSPKYKGGAYVATSRIRIKGKEKTVYLHRFVTQAEKGMQVDHKNRNTLDCRKQNLRIATPSQNNANKPLYSNNTSGYKGVTFHKPTNKWTAQITKDRKARKIGYFETALEAAKAYDVEAKKLFGEFALLNFKEKTV
jgi:hypothetical protein